MHVVMGWWDRNGGRKHACMHVCVYVCMKGESSLVRGSFTGGDMHVACFRRES